MHIEYLTPAHFAVSQARQAPPSAQPVALRGFVADAALVEDEEDAERSGGGQVREGVTVMWLQQWVATTAARLGADSRVLEGTVCRVLLGREPGEVRGEMRYGPSPTHSSAVAMTELNLRMLGRPRVFSRCWRRS